MISSCHTQSNNAFISVPNILIVDDNRDIHADFKKILNPINAVAIDQEFQRLEAMFNEANSSEVDCSAVLTSAYQGGEAIDMVRRAVDQGNPYSIAFVDVRMPPGCDGIETTRKIWECDPETQIVICSAFSDYSWQQIVRELNYSDRFLVLKKPFENIEIRQLVSVLHNRWFEGRTDPLTGLLNRRAFMNRIKQNHESLKESGQKSCCVMVDLDHFKRINDSFGHLAGDKVLRSVANVLKSNCQEGDLAGRFGGEEFCILLRNCDEEKGQQWAEETRRSLKESAIDSNGIQLSITGSFGIAEWDPRFTSNDAWIDAADRALLVSKRNGRNCCMRLSAIDALESNRQLNPHFLFQNAKATQAMQPVVSIENDASFGDAIKIMMGSHEGSLPVVAPDGKLVGMLSEQDLMRGVSECEAGSAEVEQLMNSSVVCYPSETPLVEIFHFLAKVTIPQVVILENGLPSGVIGRKALLEWLSERGFA